MLVKFELSMPGVGSWNGKWTGEENLYARVIMFRGKEREQLAKELIERGYFSYNFGDGWRAGISLEKIDVKLAQKIRKKSKGFYGYDWMIDSIIKNKKIMCKED